MSCNRCEEANTPVEKSGDECATPPVLQINNPSEVVMFHKVIIPVAMGDETQSPPTNGRYRNVLMVYEINGHAYLYSSDGVPSYISFDTGGVLTVDELPEASQATKDFLYVTKDGGLYITFDNSAWTFLATGEGSGAFNALSGRPKYGGTEMTSDTDIPNVDTVAERISGEVTALENSLAPVAQSGAYQDLSGLPVIDTQLNANSNNAVTNSAITNAVNTKQDSLTPGTNITIEDGVISAAGGEQTLYSTTGQNTDGAMTQKATTDALNNKQDALTAGSNISIIGGTISATNTTYSPFTGTDGTAMGTAGLVPAPSTTDAGKYLKADGTWATASGSGGQTYDADWIYTQASWTETNFNDLLDAVKDADTIIYTGLHDANVLNTAGIDIAVKRTRNTSQIPNSPLVLYMGSGKVHTVTFTDTVSVMTELPTEKAVITMTDTDPGEGEPLEANHFIAVY